MFEKDMDHICVVLKSYEWQNVIDLTPSLETLNESQFRFLKGFIIEIATEKCSNGELKYVGLPHKDFDWTTLNLCVELKSVTSSSFFKKNGHLRDYFSFKLNNSNGTNNKNSLMNTDVCDIIVLIKNDGVAIVDKETVIENSIKTGDGFYVNLQKKDIIMITEKLIPKSRETINFKKVIENAIQEQLKSFFCNI